MIVDGLHLGELKVQQLKIFIKSILNAAIVEGSYCEVNRILVEDIKLNPTKYAGVFDQIPNLKILNYLVDCNRLDATPYSCEYKLIHCFDADRFENGKYQLDDDQFAEIVRAFQYQTNSEDGKIRVKHLGLNAISVPVRQGLYVLAYHKLHLDVANRMMRVDEDITFCREFTFEGDKLSIRQFLEPYDMDLLDDPHANLETIKDYITLNNPNLRGVDDMPYVIAIAMDYALDLEDYLLYLNFTSVKHIKRIGEPKNKELFDIIYMDADDPERVNRFNQYLSNPENVRLFQRIFPIIATTCISAHRIGDPEVYFDMVIMDEASQCNTAVSLVPILRGESLMLVGDPQQLQPVILLNEADNQTLRKKYAVAPEYDYIANSVYKTFLACDPVSDEVLLHHHYRCHPKIIGFNNKKYYNGKLVIESNVECKTPLTFVDVEESDAVIKNTSPGEAEQIINYVRAYPGKNIGIITPFANQKMLISDELACLILIFNAKPLSFVDRFEYFSANTCHTKAPSLHTKNLIN